MQTRRLGNSELEFTTIGLGTWAMGGGDWKFGWGDQEDDQSEAAIHRALDKGINWIDTAAIYGHGRSECVVGQAVRGIRDRVLIATKCGRVWEEGSVEIGKCLRRASVRREVEASLKRLNTEYIDLYQIHWPEPDEQVEEGWDAVLELKREGKIRFGGVCNFSRSQLERICRMETPSSLQPPYSMFKADAEAELLPFCGDHHIGVVAYSPMQAGLLTGTFTRERAEKLPENDWRSRSPFFQEPQLTVNLETVEALKAIAREEGMSLSQLALAWVLRRSEMTAAIVGARDASQIEETARAGDLVLNEVSRQAIQELLDEREERLRSMESG